MGEGSGDFEPNSVQIGITRFKMNDIVMVRLSFASPSLVIRFYSAKEFYM